ncbi:hypothetical protein JL720_14670 [Aureococcus anophagefferens]|nr:hypothetical protein JL720_14670 [Aureococcus anophagefferens]
MCAAYDASQLASGKPAVRDYASPTCGWAVRCTKAPILSVAKRSLSSESHVAWKRELGLGAYGGMELPAALYGRSALELRHGASGVRLSFCALEALQPAAPAEWDWTFTTPYRGATAVADFGDGVPAEPDGASFYDGGDGGGGAAGRGARPACKRDDLDPHSFAFFRVRVRFAGKFWVAFSRFFIRVNGVLARVLDTRFVGDESRVLRERTWREGDWETFAGPGAPPLPGAPLEPSAPATVAPAWRFDGAGEAVVPAGRVALVVLRDGGGVVALDQRAGAERWRFRASATAAAADGEFVAAGLESGDVVLLDGGGAERRRFAADSAGVSRGVRASRSAAGVAAATARAVTVADAATGAVVERVACDETVNALAGGRRFARRGARVRVFFPGGRRREWTGFSSAVERLAWSASGTWLAAVGGRAVALRRDLPPGEAPEDRRAQEEESCRKLGLMLPTEAQRTAVARIPGFLSARECDDVRDVVRGLKCATIERSAGGQHVFMGPWTTTYLHTDDQFRQRLGGLRSRLLAAAVAVDGRERWGQLDETADVNFRTAEYHQYQPGGGLRDARHYDAGSLITMDLMLAAPGADRGRRLRHARGRRVEPVTRGTRVLGGGRRGPEKTCAHRCRSGVRALARVRAGRAALEAGVLG